MTAPTTWAPALGETAEAYAVRIAATVAEQEAEAAETGEQASPVEALRGIIQRDVNVTVAEFKAAFASAGATAPDDWALSGYLAPRRVAPAIAARRTYTSGKGALPSPPSGCGTWTQAQQEWAIGNGGREWLIIPWIDPNGLTVGWQVRWAKDQERIEVTDVNSKGVPVAWDTHKFDFPAGRDKSVTGRLVDSLHIDDGAPVLAVIESPVRADSLASQIPTGHLSIVAVGGITMAYEGRSNPNNPGDHLPRLSPDIIKALGGVEGRHVLWIPDNDHTLNPICNLATQQTIESLLDAGAEWVGVVDVPESVRHPRSGREIRLDEGAGVDDLAAVMDEVLPGAQWLGPLLADSTEGTEYVRLYPRMGTNDVQGLAEVVADRLADLGSHRFLGDGKGDGTHYDYSGGFWGVDHAEASVTIEATGCANRVFGSGKDGTKREREVARRNITAAVRRAPQTVRGRDDLITPEALWEPRTWAEHLPTPSGILDVAALTMHPHTPEAMNLGVTTVSWVKGAQNDDWDKFRADLFVTEARDDDDDVIVDEAKEAVWVHDADKERMVQECLGAALLGKTYDTGLFLLGAGGSGISTLVGAFVGVLPTAYVGSLSSAELTGKENQFVLSSIPFARFAEIGEFGPNDMLNDKLWKLISQDASQLPIEPKFGDKYQAFPRTTTVSTTNHLPGVSAAAGQDNSLRRRACIAKFTRIVKKPDSSLQDRLATPGAKAAILAWAVEGAHRFLNSETRKPFRSEESDGLVDEWVTDHDRLARFIEDKLRASPVDYVERGDVFDAYISWCEENVIEPRWRLEKSNLIKRMERRTAFGSSDSNGNRRNVNGTTQRGWRGWRIV